MNNKGFSTLILLIHLMSSEIAGQNTLSKGYYIARDSSKVEGYFRRGNLSFNKINFYPNPEEKTPIPLYPSDVLEVKTDKGIHLISWDINNSNEHLAIFIEEISNGDVSLYKGSTSLEGDFFLISSIDAPGIVRINKHGPGQFLKAFFNTSCVVTQQITYNQRSLLKAITQYCKCKGYLFAGDSKLKKYKTEVHLGVRMGYYKGNPKVNRELVGEYEKVKGFSGGGDLRLQIGRNFGFQAGANFLRKTLKSSEPIEVYMNYKGWIHQRKDSIQFSYSTLEIPLEFSYNPLNRYRLSPFFALGAAFQLSRKPILERGFTVPRTPFDPTAHDFSLQEVTANPPKDLRVLVKNHIYVFARVGASIKIGKNIKLEPSIRIMKEGDEFLFHYVRYFSVTTRNRMDFFLTCYIPLIKPKT